MAFNRLPEINGSALKAAREKRGMERSELATECCLSNKMVLELEEGGITAFYSFQLKVSSAKRVGSFLGLSPSEYLEQVVAVVESVDPPIDVQNAPTQVEENQMQVSSPKPVVDEGEQLDDLIYQSTNSGTSLPHLGMRTVPAKWIGVSLGLLMAVAAFYTFDSRFDISKQALVFLERMKSKQVEHQQAPQELALQEPQQDPVEEKSSVKAETKAEPVLAVASSQSQCPQVRDDQLSVYRSPNPSKLGDAVNVKTLVKQSICVADGQGKQTSVELEPNTAHSFKGVPPFVVLAQDLDSVEMYYQGWRVRPPSSGLKQLKLVEVAIQ